MRRASRRHLPRAADETPVDFSDLPADFIGLISLMKSWAVSDDQQRSEKLSRAPSPRLTRLVKQVTPHLGAIDVYLESFQGRAIAESAAAPGCLAECALEAQLVLAERQTPSARR